MDRTDPATDMLNEKQSLFVELEQICLIVQLHYTRGIYVLDRFEI